MLGLLEADFRELALLALADWDAIGLVEPDLFPAIAALNRPAWGSWNFLLQSLRSARKKQLRTGAANVRAALERGTTLAAILALLDHHVSPDLEAATRPLVDYLKSKQRVKRMIDALALPITLRNQIAHFPPHSDAGWDAIAAALSPLVQWHADHPPPIADLPHPEPWFLDRDGTAWAFNGIDSDFAARYAAVGESTPYEDAARGADVVKAIARMLGRADVRAQSFHRLLGKLAPEDIRGVVLGDFFVGAPVGRGGFATVHVARQLSTNRKVAIKLLHDGMPEDARQRFQLEAEFLSRFDHPNIVRVISYGEDAWSVPRHVELDGEPWFAEFSRGAAMKSYLALEWIEGETLDAVFARGRVAIDVLRDYFRAAASAIVAIHAAGLVHRDIKPANLMVSSDGALHVMDFGVARSDDEARTVLTTASSAVGTPPYMSPEQLRALDADAEVGPASDLYSLCATFYELATGQRIFGHDREAADTIRTKKLRGERPTPPREVVRDVPWELETIVLGGLEPEIADRYGSAAALVRDLEHWAADEPLEYRRPSVARRLRLAYRRHRTVANIVGVALVAFAAGGILYLQNVRAARDEAERQAHRAKTAKRESDELAVSLLVDQGRQELVGRRPRQASAYLAEAYRRAETPSVPLRAMLAHAIERLPRFMIETHEVAVAVGMSRDGKAMLVARSGVLELRDPATGTLRDSIAIPGEGVGHSRVLPDGRVVLQTPKDVAIVDLVTRHVVVAKDLALEEDLTARVTNARGDALVGRGAASIKLVDTRTGSPTLVIDGVSKDGLAIFDRDDASITYQRDHDVVERRDLLTGAVTEVKENVAWHYNHAGRAVRVERVDTVLSSARVRIDFVDVATGGVTANRTIMFGNAYVQAVSPGGDRVVLRTAGPVKLILVNGVTRDPIQAQGGYREIDTRCPLCSIEFDPTGQLLVQTHERGVALFDGATGAWVGAFEVSTASTLQRVAFSTTGELAYAMDARAIYAIELVPWYQRIAAEPFYAIDATGSRRAVLREGLRIVERGRPDVVLASPGADSGFDLQSLAFVGSDRFVAVIDVGSRRDAAPSKVGLWDTRTGAQVATLADSVDPRATLAASPDGACVAYGSAPIAIWCGRDPMSVDLDFPTAHRLAWSADGRRLAASLRGQRLAVVDVASRKPLAIVDTAPTDHVPSVREYLAISASGNLVANAVIDPLAADEFGIVTASKLVAIAPRRDLMLADGIFAITDHGRAFGERHIYETATGRPACVFAERHRFEQVVFDASGTLALAKTADGTLMFDASTCKPLGTPVRLEWHGARPLGPRPDGSLATWEIPLEQRPAADVAKLVLERSKWKLENGALVSTESAPPVKPSPPAR